MSTTLQFSVEDVRPTLLYNSEEEEKQKKNQRQWKKNQENY